MKSRGIGGGRKATEAISEDLHQIVFDAVQAERKMIMIALIRHFGLGRKRLKQFIDTFNATEVEFKRYETDGIYDEKVEEEFERLGLRSGEIFPQKTPFKLLRRKEKLSHEVRVEYSEAKRIHSQMVGFGNYVKKMEENKNE